MSRKGTKDNIRYGRLEPPEGVRRKDETRGQNIWTGVDDISLDKGRQVTPDSLYSFLCWFVSQEKDFQFDMSCKCSYLDEKRRVLMVAQDMIHTSTHSRVKTPKHGGLAITVHHLTGSKQLVTLFNKMAHCSSCDEVEVVYTSLAREINARSEEFGVIVPSNITPGGFVQCPADNNDLNEDTVDGLM